MNLQAIYSRITDNTLLYFQGILFLTFFGHGLASLGVSHSGYELHHHIFESVNYFHWDADTFLVFLGWWDIFLAFAVLSGIAPRLALPMALVYLCAIAIVGFLYYHSRTGSYFGIGETARRFAWIFYTVFLLFYTMKQEKRFSLLRVGISFAFLSHGFASLGFFGMRGGQIELAAQIFPEEIAKTLVFYSGFSDVFLGTLLCTGFFSRLAAIFGSMWLVVVVLLSFMLGIPEGIFRSAFFLSCVYVALDKRCHSALWGESSETTPTATAPIPVPQ